VDQARLRQLLTELHNELASTTPVDAANRELLNQLATDIQAMGGSPESYRSLRGRLVDAAAALEATHPKVTTALERVIDTLAFFNI
jgi:hypothetical protein